MFRLVLHSVLTLGVLFGILFAVLTAALVTQGAPVWLALIIVIGFAGLQYLISPFIIQWIHKIEWMPVDSIDQDVAAMVREICAQRRLREPRFGLIRDGNPNAFTFGHYPGNARVIVTTGLLEVCDTSQRKAVVAHEMGHVVHWDAVVMTVAATVPLVLYYIYRFGIRAGRGSRRSGGGALLVALAAFIFYIITQYIVLFLSRVREYYADHYSAEITGDPNALATGLVRIAYGLARSKPANAEADERAPSAAAIGMKAFGIFDPTYGKSMAVASAGAYGLTGQAESAVAATDAMKWDLWNPWAFFMELKSTHPLPAKRIRALGHIATQRGQSPPYQLPEHPQESYWDEFMVDLGVAYLPLAGLLAGLIVGAVFGFGQQMWLTGAGCAALGLGLGMLAKMAFVYPRGRFADRQVRSLVAEVEVSGVRPVPSRLRGTVIGRGIPGLYWGDDLVVQDDTGFMLMQYRQPLAVLEFLFGLFRAESFIGQQVIAEGWYRRAPVPYLELWKVHLPNGEIHTCHDWAFSLMLALFVTGGGLLAALLGLIGSI